MINIDDTIRKYTCIAFSLVNFYFEFQANMNGQNNVRMKYEKENFRN